MHHLRRFLAPASLAIAALLVLILAAQNRSLEQRYADCVHAMTHPRAGRFVPEFATTALDGTPITLAKNNGTTPQLLIFFTTTCPYCRASLPAWHELYDSSQRLPPDKRPQVIGASLDSADATLHYVNMNGLPFPVVTFPYKQQRLYNVRGVPQIMIVGNDGRIAFARSGALDTRPAIDSVLSALSSPAASPPSAARSR